MMNVQCLVTAHPVNADHANFFHSFLSPILFHLFFSLSLLLHNANSLDIFIHQPCTLLKMVRVIQ